MHDAPPVVLIVAEDDAPLRQLLARALRRKGYTVLEASDGHELVALAMAPESAPALVISDVQMPLLSGPQALARLRSDGLSCPVILITAFGGEEARAAVASLGDCVVMDKPVEIAELELLVRQRLGGVVAC